MRRLVLDQRLGKDITSRRLELHRNVAFDGLCFSLQVKAEVAASPLEEKPLVLSGATENDACWPEHGILSHQIVRQCCSLDSGAGDPEPIGEVS
jgi:hypothetical protein